jgi:GT2 family glycosyltransferase
MVDHPTSAAWVAGGAEPARLAELDLLSQGVFEGARRSQNGLEIVTPWARASCGDVWLEPGWWRIDSDLRPEAAGVRVMLSTPADPLVILDASLPGQRVFVRAEGPVTVSATLGAWPGLTPVTRLRLVRLGPMEIRLLMLGGVMRLLRNPARFRVLAEVVRRLMAGQAVGMNAGGAAPVAPAAGVDPRPAAPADASPPRSASGQGVVVRLREGETLHVRALDIAAAAFARAPHLRAIVPDVISGHDVFTGPRWDPELARHGWYAPGPVFFREGDATEGQSDPSLINAIIGQSGAGAIGRIALPLVRAARPPWTKAVLRPPAPVLERTPLVSVVIPTKFRMDLLDKALTGLRERTGYTAIEVLVVDNDSPDAALPDLIARQAAAGLDVRLVPGPGEFNFPRLIDLGVQASRGEIVLLLNDDIEPVEPGWLHRLVESALQPGVGAVGARLLYPGGDVQHAGVWLGVGGLCGHLWKGLDREAAEHNPHVALPGSRMAVTGACLALTREAYDRVGGLDAEAFPVAFNDIDLCLRLGEAGLRTVYRGDVVLVHHESQSRGPDDATPATRRRLAAESAAFIARWGRLLRSDPWLSPAIDTAVETGRIQQAALSQADQDSFA